jgi:mercuric ion transport protein
MGKYNMKEQITKPSKKGLYAATIGTVLIALCCFTPILVILLSVIGLSALTSYLDYVLLPALAFMIVLSFLSYKRWEKSSIKAGDYRRNRYE